MSTSPFVFEFIAFFCFPLNIIVFFFIIDSGFEKDPKKSKFEVIGTAPLVAIVGKYRINGKVLFLPIVGNGRANLTFENVNIHAKVIPKVETRKDGKEYVIIDKVKIRMTVSKWVDDNNCNFLFILFDFF